MTEAVRKRIVGTTERPVACLLSGGLDSSLITALVNKFYNSPLETYSIAMEGGEDLKYARMVAEFLGTQHTEVILTEEQFLEAIPDVIETVESYDTTTIRASVGNYLVAKYIKEHSDAKVIFNGDGSDEVTGGYLYLHNSPSAQAFDIECRRLIRNIHTFDVQRSDRCISSHGLEPRTPFLDKRFVDVYLSINKHIRKTDCEKYLLRKAFVGELPSEVLWRTKEAFSDGISQQKRSWYEIIEEFVSNKPLRDINTDYLNPTTKEQTYYRQIFENIFGSKNSKYVIPYFWMPRFCNETLDCSARTLNIYKVKTKRE